MYMATQYFLESRSSKAPDKWYRHAYAERSLEEAKKVVQGCLKRVTENGESNFKECGFRVLEYRIVEVNTFVEETPLLNFPIKNDVVSKKLHEAKQDQLHFLNQILKYLKHLEYIHKTGILKDDRKALYTEISIFNTNSEIEKLLKEIESEHSI